jgi:predicted nucleotidyltransferase
VADVLRSGLARIAKDIRVAFIYGSIAKGAETAESDVDLFVVADSLALADIVTALRHAQEELRREVNPTVYQTKEFFRKLTQGHHFVSKVVAGPKIFLVGDEGELARLGEIRVDQAASSNARRGRGVVRARRS